MTVTPVDTLGYNPYQAYNQYYYYPAPQYAVPAQVPYPQVVTIPQGVQIQQGPQEDEVVKTNENLTTFKASDEIQKEKKSNGKAWAVLGALATVGLAILGKKAYKLGSADLKGLARLKNGAGQIKDICWKHCKKWLNKGREWWDIGVNWVKKFIPAKTPAAVT